MSELENYIKSELESGVTMDTIKKALINNGWPNEDIEGAFGRLEHNAVPVPQVNPVSEQVETGSQTQAKKNNLVKVLVGIVFLVILSTAVSVAFVTDLLPFGRAPYSEDELVSGIVSSLAKMETFTYSVKGTLEVEERDQDAKPFVVGDAKEMAEFKKKYLRDYDRASALSSILYQLEEMDEYPKTLAEVMKEDDEYYSYYSVRGNDITDPLTGKEYSYNSTGDNFKLSATFETADALNSIDQYGDLSNGGTEINKATKNVTFTKDSSSYFYISSSVPKPFFEELNDMMSYLPPELRVDAGVSVVTDFTKEDFDWEVAFDGSGDFGDLSYKLAGDVMKKGTDYYYRIRNIPSLYAIFLTFEKGKWVRMTKEWMDKETNGYDEFFSPTFLIPSEDEQEELNKNKEDMGKFVAEVVKIADQEGVVLVNDKPKREKKNNKNLYRYELSFNKDKILSFVEKVSDEADKYEVTRDSEFFNDTALIEYLKSDNFDTVFDYYNNNTSIVLWLSKEGFVEAMDYTIRVVPPAEATKLANKQARLTISSTFTNINQPVVISAPEEYTDIEDLMEETTLGFGLEDSRDSAKNASIKSTLSSARNQSELYYNTNSYSYAGLCKDTSIKNLLEMAQNTRLETTNGITLDTTPTIDNVACLDEVNRYVIQAPLVETDDGIYTHWCVDSTGYSGGGYETLDVNSKACP